MATKKESYSAAAYKKAAAIRSSKTASTKGTNLDSVETPTRVSVDETPLDDDHTEEEGKEGQKESRSYSSAAYKKAMAMRSGSPKEMYDSLTPEQQASLVDFIGGLKKASESAAASAPAPPAAVTAAATAAAAKLPTSASIPTSADVALAKETMKARALDSSDPMVERMIEKLKAKAKTSLTSEPDMPQVVQRFYRYGVDMIWPDVRLEIKSALAAAVLTAKEPEPVDLALMPPWYHPLRWRAFLVYHHLPCDKGGWTKLRRDPFYVLMEIVCMIPVFGIRQFFFALLLVLLLVPRAEMDQFQLTAYVLKFKGTQFFAGGILLAIQGGLSLYDMTTFESDPIETHDALEVEAPGVGEGTILETFDLAGSVLLGWVALLALPHAGMKGARVAVVETKATQERDKSYNEGASHLRKLLIYDVFMFGATICMFFVLTEEGSFKVNTEDWRTASTLFWCRVCYSLTTFPFFFFTLPFLSKVLTHAEPTGFNALGQCVPFQIPAAHKKNDDEDDDDDKKKKSGWGLL